MKKEATVVSEGGKLYAEIVRSEACQQCRMCSFGKKERMLYKLPEGTYSVGDSVTIELEDRTLTKAVLLAYGMPFIALMAGLILGYLIFDSELMQVLSALLFLACGLVYLWKTEKKRRESGAYECSFKKEE